MCYIHSGIASFTTTDTVKAGDNHCSSMLLLVVNFVFRFNLFYIKLIVWILSFQAEHGNFIWINDNEHSVENVDTSSRMPNILTLSKQLWLY